MEAARTRTRLLLRTPDARFEHLPDYPFDPHHTEVAGPCIDHVEMGSLNAESVLMLHGEPTWSYLYRHMTPIIPDAGHRAIVPDLIWTWVD